MVSGSSYSNPGETERTRLTRAGLFERTPFEYPDRVSPRLEGYGGPSRWVDTESCRENDRSIATVRSSYSA
jgi:hypothetical protein